MNVDEPGGEGSASRLIGGARMGRYTLVAKLGEGGMGEVWEAVDRDLGRHVALKLVREDKANRPGALSRLRREAQTMARLQHPNIAVVHEVDRVDERLYVAMELLRGGSLRPWLSSQRTWREIVDVFAAAGRGLAAAHRAGVIHRDFKPENVLLGANGEIRVADFGLARNAIPELRGGTPDAAAPASDGELAGTPAYMAPEQILGAQLDARCDQFSFCVALWEALAGTRPFEVVAVDGVPTLALRIAAITAPDARARGDVPRAIAGPLQRGLSADRDQRFPTMDALLHAIDAATLGRRRRRWLVGVVALLALVTAGAIATHGSRAPATTTASPVLAVLPLRSQDAGAEQQWLAGAFAELLSTELGAAGELRVVPTDLVARVRSELGPEVDAVDRASPELRHLARLGCGADRFVVGEYALSSNEITVSLRIVEPETGRVEATVRRRGSIRDLVGLVTGAGDQIRQALGAVRLPTARVIARAAMPSSVEAARYYAIGLAHLRRFEAAEARAALEQVTRLDPSFASGFIALAAAHRNLFDTPRAIAAAEQAVERAGGLDQEQRLAIEGERAELKAQWVEAVDRYQALFRFHPESIEYGLLLARALKGGGRPKEALGVLATLVKLSSDPRIALLEAEACNALQDLPCERTAADRALAAAEERHSPSLAAPALLRRSEARSESGDTAGGLQDLLRARSLAADSGNRGLVAATYRLEGIAHWMAGDLVAARRAMEADVALCQELGDHDGLSEALLGLANVVGDQGDFESAKKIYLEDIAILRERRHRNLPRALESYGTDLIAHGDFAEADQVLLEAIAVSREAQDDRGIISALSELALSQYKRGDLKGAEARGREVIQAAENSGDRKTRATAQSELAQVLLAAGETAEARQLEEQALHAARELGDRQLIARLDLELADLLIGGGEDRHALELVDDALTALAGQKQDLREGLARARRARTLLALGREPEARQEATLAQPLLHDLDASDLGAAAAIEMATVLSGVGEPQQARTWLAEVGEQQLSLPMRLHVHVARAALRPKGRARTSELQRLQGEAQRRGLLDVARIAGGALR